MVEAPRSWASHTPRSVDGVGDPPGDDFEQKATEHLIRLTGRPDAVFRGDQLEAIRATVQRRARQLLVQRTGWGKTAVYFIATRMLRDGGAGPTILITPLLALMRNQIEAAERMGLRAVTINSGNREDWGAITAELDAGTVDLLLISAPRLANTEFVDDVLPTVARSTGLLVVDEAHCISDWGHDFVPDYRRVVRVLDRLPRGIPVLCCTATANDRVVADVEHQLGDDIETRRGPLARDSLALSVIDLPSPAERIAWLDAHLERFDGTGIIYCLTIADAERVAACLRAGGHDVAAYTGSTDPEIRADLERRLLANEVKALVATSALGMGIDKPDLGFVIHYQAPGTPIAYYQQVGRAGRALDRAAGVLLRGAEDADIQDWFITTAFPEPEHATAVVSLLEEAGRPVSLGVIEASVNVHHSRLESMLKILEVEGAVQRVKGGYQRTLAPWAYDLERVERVTAARRAEQEQMRAYATTDGCRMQFLAGQLDDPHAAPCGRCDNCTGEPATQRWPRPAPEAVATAIACLRHNEQRIEPRRQWPTGMDDPRGRIPPDRQPLAGIALSRWGDGGWGELVRRGRQTDGRFADELVAASAGLLGGWSADAIPEWVTAVPSLRAPEPVPDFAARLAEGLSLPFAPVLVKDCQTRPQKEMANSAQQVRNLWGVFSVTQPVPSGPVLLVDDVVDSRWTLTVISWLLTGAGVPAVVPFALCEARGS